MRLSLLALFLTLPIQAADAKLKTLIIDGQNNHNWKATTPILKQQLEATNRFTVEVATAPAGKVPDSFAPKFADYDVVVSNYNGEPWPEATQKAFVEYLKNGGGFVAVHAADNSFPNWPEYNEAIGVGGWGGRDEKSGPYVRWRDNKIVRDDKKGNGGSHGAKHPFAVTTRNGEHPITQGLPKEWMHASDELYDRLRGPAENMTVLATAFADPKQGGSGEHEPMLMAIQFGKGRSFHTTLGHDTVAMNDVGFSTTLARGAEWAATGKVTIPVPENFPTPDKVSPIK